MTRVKPKNLYISNRGSRGSAWKSRYFHGIFCYISDRGSLNDCSCPKKWRISAVEVNPLSTKGEGTRFRASIPIRISRNARHFRRHKLID